MWAGLALWQAGVPRPGIGRTVARKDNQVAALGVEKRQPANLSGLFHGGLDRVRVGRESSLSLLDLPRLRRRHQRVVGASDGR